MVHIIHPLVKSDVFLDTDAQAHTVAHYGYTARLCVSSITPKQRRLIMLPAGEWRALH